LSEQPASPQLGTRHRAALGLSERLETCVCIVVSEGTGSISLAERGHLHRLLTSTKLREMLETRLGGGGDSAVRPRSELATPRPVTRLRQLLTRLLGPTPPQGS
ncbi:MAG: DNA integrity scanning protein DisA nucleotide-binding domain protein, partial [Gloeomargaritaceae cyanobacterium C42_A2020_066]|nr:DNA integrity scanning protein DisA nucleotide-binding domain protein [Gloeomargaritaceae cyanobacterium C42_A2020_066]